MVQEHFPGAITAGNGAGPNTDPKALALTLAEKMVELSGADPDAIEDAIHETLDAAVLAAQGLKALSDPRSAALFLERGDKRRQRRKREAIPEPSPENAVFVRKARGEAPERNEEPHPVFPRPVPIEDKGEVRSEPKANATHMHNAPAAREDALQTARSAGGYEGPDRRAPLYNGGAGGDDGLFHQRSRGRRRGQLA
jgi:hypothetical protein